ncbi:MAG: AlpA family phage regulatory protein [Magnetococcales bacterium]|nr:AlpA family phage regulatory protein [Magnetococcales bacterium]
MAKNIQGPGSLPSTGFVRLPLIIGNPKAKPPIPAVIPVSNSSWWNGVASGIYPKPVKLGPRTTAWRVEDILKLIEKLGGQAASA